MEAPERTRRYARKLRRQMDLPEVLLWNRLRRRQLGGLHFRRQHPLGNYIIDFCCDEAKLAVEVDGYSHDVAGRPERDQRRDAWMAGQDVTTLRIPARDVLKAMEDVLATILAAAGG